MRTAATTSPEIASRAPTVNETPKLEPIQSPKLGYVREWLSSRYARLGAMGLVLLLGALLLVDVWKPRRSEQ